mgnify:CR=1 FL=1|tara:strand:+ start:2519 stop:3250 length:732 start_codon:yes stop_codon:yes gene_type:complete
MSQGFPLEVQAAIRHYVYRLIDPRTGETFYVGKGRGDRVFAHARGVIDGEDDAASEKLKRIRQIQSAGFDVQHVIHRHGLEATVALEVEAALLDCFPGLTNAAGGHGSGERGVRHADEIIREYTADEVEFHHRTISIVINNTASERSIYDAVRGTWKLSERKARKAELVVAVLKGIIVGVFVPKIWLAATPENFPFLDEPRAGRLGFEGEEASPDIRGLYLLKRPPSKKKGAANPVRYYGYPS